VIYVALVLRGLLVDLLVGRWWALGAAAAVAGVLSRKALRGG
jgi:hypothetical protein